MSKFKWFTVKFNFDTSSASNDCITQSLIGNAFCLDVKLTFRQLYLSTACLQLDLKNLVINPSQSPLVKLNQFLAKKISSILR